VKYISLRHFFTAPYILMNIQRRSFLRNTSLVTGLLLLQKPFRSLAAVADNATYLPGNNRELMIWYTNDQHGQLTKLLPVGQQGLFLDAGDFTHHQHSIAENAGMIQTMNKAGYHAATIGNRELANGQAALAALIPYMQFALVNCNYRFSDQVLSRNVLPYKIVYAGSLKIGITAVGPQLDKESGVTCLPPVAAANEVAIRLKEEHGCQVVICLSHLGFEQKGDIADNRNMATDTTHIDFVIGGHQQTLLQSPMIYRNIPGHEVYLSQAGHDGVMVGKMKMLFDEERQGCGIQPGCVMA
jgi:5'-nucleotidase